MVEEEETCVGEHSQRCRVIGQSTEAGPKPSSRFRC